MFILHPGAIIGSIINGIIHIPAPDKLTRLPGILYRKGVASCDCGTSVIYKYGGGISITGATPGITGTHPDVYLPTPQVFLF